MNICAICGIPQDAGFFDESNIFKLDLEGKRDPSLNPGQELVLARYELHRNYCGILMYFAQFIQFTKKDAENRSEVQTPGYQWQIRCNGQPRDPYLGFDHIINPWGLSGFPVYLRLEEGCVLEFVIRNMGASGDHVLSKVGGRILGRYWYNNIYGGLPNRL
ncbi:MAG: hypothetical protein N2235_24955 [Fischerella sp.]|nr:hypothetical protein [Fischerella sp.]